MIIIVAICITISFMIIVILSLDGLSFEVSKDEGLPSASSLALGAAAAQGLRKRWRSRRAEELSQFEMEKDKTEQ